MKGTTTGLESCIGSREVSTKGKLRRRSGVMVRKSYKMGLCTKGCIKMTTWRAFV